MEVLHLTEDATFNRVETARVARRFPVVIDMLSTGALSPTTVRVLAKFVTRENHRELFATAAFKSKRQVEELLSHFFPQADVPSFVRKRPIAADRVLTFEPGALGTVMPFSVRRRERRQFSGRPSAGTHRDGSAVGPRGRHPSGPLAPDRYEIRFTASASTREKLRHAQDLLAHAVPSGDLDTVFGRSLTLLVEDLTRKRFAAVERPHDSHDGRDHSGSGKRIPAAVRREVYGRDGGRCAFIARGGRRCNDRRFIEFHHVLPVSVGGKSTVENIQLRCRAHNGHEVDLFFGPGKRYQGDDEVHEPEDCLRNPVLQDCPVPERNRFVGTASWDETLTDHRAAAAEPRRRGGARK